jgi:DnaD/phage-associated family protein
MAKVRLEKENTRNPMLFSTTVENLFISELLPAAPGNFVKVYLLGLMNAEYGISPEMTSTVNVLNMTVEEIESAWAYWEEKGAVRRVYDANIHAYRIQFISQIEELYGGTTSDAGATRIASYEAGGSTGMSASGGGNMMANAGRTTTTGSMAEPLGAAGASGGLGSSGAPNRIGSYDTGNRTDGAYVNEFHQEASIPAPMNSHGRAGSFDSPEVPEMKRTGFTGENNRNGFAVDSVTESPATGSYPASGSADGMAGNASGNAPGAASEENSEMDELARLEELEIAALYEQVMEAKGGTISPRDMSRIRDAIRIYNVSPDVYSYAIKYCRELQKYDVNYITNVALRWKEKGCDDIVQVKNLLDQESRRNSEYRSIFQAVGFHRAWTPADRQMMDTWLDDWGFSMAEVLDACRTTAGMRDPDLRYVNRVLQNKMKEAGGIDTRKDGSGAHSGSGSRSGSGDSYQRSVSKRVLGAYYEYLRNEAELEYQNHIETAKREIPQIADVLALENELNKAIMMSFSFNAKAKEERQIQIQKRKDLDLKKRKLLKEHGYPEDYLDKKFKCERCKDTGITDDGQYCTCTKERVNEAYRWNLRRTKQN